jgi:hypothetical protein
MGCCLLSLFVTLGPRLALVFMWLFTERISLAFNNTIVPLLGLIFLPLTTFAYVIFYDPLKGLSGLAWVVVIVAFVVDLAINGGTIYGNRNRVLER